MQMSSEAENIQNVKVEIPEWDDTGESILELEWLKVKYEGP